MKLKKVTALILASVFCTTAIALSASAQFGPWLSVVGIRTHMEHKTPESTKILLLGNSLTYYNNGPGLFSSMIRFIDPNCKCTVVSGLWPGISLTSISKKSEAQKLLSKIKWNYVILQEFSGEAFKGPDAVEQGMKTLLPAVNSCGAKAICVMTFADKTNHFHQSVISQSYKDATSHLKVPHIPLGNMFFYLEETQPTIDLYDADHHHPGAQGTYLYMLALCKQIFGNEKFQKLKNFRTPGLDEKTCLAIYNCVENWEQIEKAHPELIADIPGNREDIAEYWLKHGKSKQAEELLLRRLKHIEAKSPQNKPSLSLGHTLLSLAKAQLEQNTHQKNALAHDNLVRAEQVFLKLEGVNGKTVKRIKEVLELR